ncbi:unnamed protein product [Moneuplotes crassus]|uniref:Uncharacterized protein n=1 Tax=Euplotes crassus TaxID=5936 RepID=A0AAD1XC51_EUPCR|nr:unnamed protein product [Moneuplotes crassus]
MADNNSFTPHPNYQGAFTPVQISKEAKSLNMFFTNIYNVNVLIQNVLNQEQRLNFLYQGDQPGQLNLPQITPSGPTLGQEDGLKVPNQGSEEDNTSTSEGKIVTKDSQGIINQGDSQAQNSDSSKTTLEEKKSTETGVAPIMAWNLKIDSNCKSQNLDPTTLLSNLTSCECPNFGASNTKQEIKKIPKTERRTVDAGKDGNMLLKMQRFYQAFYMKISKVLPKGMNSKKQIMEAMCDKLRKTTLLSEVEKEDLLLHLGAIIYPSKAYLKNKAAFMSSTKSSGKEGELKAKKAIFDFHDTLLNFSAEKLGKLLSQSTFDKLYGAFLDNLNKSIKKISESSKSEETVSKLTNKISGL